MNEPLRWKTLLEMKGAVSGMRSSYHELYGRASTRSLLLTIACWLWPETYEGQKSAPAGARVLWAFQSQANRGVCMGIG